MRAEAIQNLRPMAEWILTENVLTWLDEKQTQPTDAEIDAEIINIQAKADKPQTVSMRQARLALLQGGLLSTVETAIVNGTDDVMKIEWEYATEVNRDWTSLISLTTTLGMTSVQLDDLFLLADSL